MSYKCFQKHFKIRIFLNMPLKKKLMVFLTTYCWHQSRQACADMCGEVHMRVYISVKKHAITVKFHNRIHSQLCYFTEIGFVHNCFHSINSKKKSSDISSCITMTSNLYRPVGIMNQTNTYKRKKESTYVSGSVYHV